MIIHPLFLYLLKISSFVFGFFLILSHNTVFVLCALPPFLPMSLDRGSGFCCRCSSSTRGSEIINISFFPTHSVIYKSFIIQLLQETGLCLPFSTFFSVLLFVKKKGYVLFQQNSLSFIICFASAQVPPFSLILLMVLFMSSLSDRARSVCALTRTVPFCMLLHSVFCEDSITDLLP